MTRLLQQAIVELQMLPDSGQDAMAALILEELADDAKWESAFENSQQELSRVANKVRDDIKQGRVRNMVIDEL
ncbi:MAG TPA: hypothetical protein VFW73_07390 [Lacipirellulaceae bacterium]|nr:hypothetical protein [Lacipirellulaceae bacterium]